MVFLTGSLRHWILLTVWLRLVSYIFATDVDPAKLDACPGYNVQNVKTNGGSLTADLMLAGQACNVFGQDLPALSLRVDYETSKLSSLRNWGHADSHCR
jgi:alpha-glucosidase